MSPLVLPAPDAERVTSVLANERQDAARLSPLGSLGGRQGHNMVSTSNVGLLLYANLNVYFSPKTIRLERFSVIFFYPNLFFFSFGWKCK